MSKIQLQPVSLARMVRAVEKVRQRLLRSTAVLEKAGVPYAVVGGYAVAAWMARVDIAAVRNTQDVDLLVWRNDFDRAKASLEAAGFVHRRTRDVDMFLDEAGASARDAVRLVMAGEKVNDNYVSPAPDITKSQRGEQFQVLALEPLVEMKLNSWRDKDRTHLRDLIDIGLIDDSWPARFPAELGQRLQNLLDTPEG